MKSRRRAACFGVASTLTAIPPCTSRAAQRWFNSGQGYSRYLIALARQHIAGLWLTSIILNGAGHDIALQGQTTRADLLPRYLQNLSHESQLQGLELQIFHLNRNMDKTKSHYTGTFGFMVATTDTGGNKQ